MENFLTFPEDEVGTVGNDENRSLPDNTDPSADLEGFLKTGMVGIGDIDISPDGKILYVVNVYNRKLYSINTEDGSVLSSVDIPRECSDENDTRPFALKYNDDTVYVGVTCTEYNSQDVNDLKAIIYSYKDESF